MVSAMETDSKAPLSSRISALVHSHFDGLPSRSKPTVRSDGTREWVPMSGVVVVRGENTPAEKLTCVAVTSGAKCLSASQVPNGKGLVLHDWHAEILALRAFNYWLLSECRGVLARERASSGCDGHSDGQKDNQDQDRGEEEEESPSPYIRRRRHPQSQHPPSSSLSSSPIQPPFELHPSLKIYMYCTTAPCGDASMELCMASQDDPTPWALPPNPDRTTSTSTDENKNTDPTLPLSGRAHFSLLGVVRRKPARADAESTRSKSCSDKLALRQVSSLLSYESSLLVAVTENAYLEGVVLPEREVSWVGCARAFGGEGRMRGLGGRWWGVDADDSNDSVGDAGGDSRGGGEKYGYRFRPFRVLSIPNAQHDSLWAYGKSETEVEPQDGAETKENPEQDATATPPPKRKPAVISAVWTAAPSLPHPPSTTDNGAKSLPTLRGSKTGLYETLINGVKQGNRATTPLARGASALSRAKLWGVWREMMRICAEDEGEEGAAPRAIVEAAKYRDFKKDPPVITQGIRARRRAVQETKDVLGGWVSNVGDEDWGLEVLVDPKKRKR